jgi:predicted DNA binding CopG/RHH family protein
MARNAVLAVRVEKELLDDVRMRAEKDGIAYSEVVRTLIIAYVENEIKINPTKMEIQK